MLYERQYDPENEKYNKRLEIDEILWLNEKLVERGLRSRDHTRLVAWILGIYLAEEILFVTSRTTTEAHAFPERKYLGADRNRKIKLCNEIADAITKWFGVTVYGNMSAILGEYQSSSQS